MQVFDFKNYDEYVHAQKKGFFSKRWKVWAVEENIKHLCNYMTGAGIIPQYGLCHGVRQGIEMAWFAKYLPGCHVIGSEIGGVIGDNTVRWDFNKQNTEWIGVFDFIYSNSFDHAFDPVNTLNIWAAQLKAGGIIMLEYDKRQEHTGEISRAVNKMDCVSITVDELVERVPAWIEGASVSVIDMPVIKKQFQKTVIIKC